jgi:hypothetical protein
MPAFTTNRGYPYSLPADPNDVPHALQSLAEAIDLDMQLLDDSIVQPPFAKVSSHSTTKQSFPSSQITEAEYDFVDVDTAGISNLSTQPTRLTPTTQGFWLVWGGIEVGFGTARTRDVFLRRNGSDITRYELHLNDPTGSGGQMMTLGAMAFMNGTTDYFTMTFTPDNSTTDYLIGNKQLAAFRLTAM